MKRRLIAGIFFHAAASLFINITNPIAPSVNITSPPVKSTREPFKLDLLPFVSIGVSSVRPGPRHDPPPGYRVVCPSDRLYCIDYQSSDNGTCMYPDPLEIKSCYDRSCTGSAWGALVRRQQGEDTYCKDFMTPQGRVCQWLDSVPCSCEARSIFYYSGEFIAPDEAVPYGFTEAHPCTYPLDVIRKAQEEASLKAKRDKRRKRQRRRGHSQDDSEDGDPVEDDKQVRKRDSRTEFDSSGTENHVTNVILLTAIIIPTCL